MAQVRLEGVRKEYENGFVAVRDATFEIGDGELVVLVGPSGCGKSTTLRMIAGMESITRGALYIGDRLVNDVAPKDRDIAMVFQNYALYPHMTVYDNLAFGLRLRKLPKRDIDAQVRQAADILAFSRVGLLPDSGSTWTLPRLIGYSRAYEMAITADRIPADKAYSWGMVNEVVPHDQLPEVVAAWANTLATGPTLAYGLTKRAMRRADSQTLNEALDYESHLQEIAGRSHDSAEGVLAFIEKREPEFTGE
jgi:hypothetical protein